MRRLSALRRFSPVSGSGRGLIPSWLRLPTAMVGMFFATEFVDEFSFGLREAAWPAIRTDLGMDYLLVGLVLGVPAIISAFLQIGIGVAGDTWLRKWLMVGGGVLFGAALLLMATSVNGWMLLGATILFFPASGALVSLSLGTLMDRDPKRHQRVMARWVFVGSLGVVAGTLVIAGTSVIGLSWRYLFSAVGIGALLLTAAIAFRTLEFPGSNREFNTKVLAGDLRNVWQTLRSWRVARWLILLEFSDLMLDVLLGFLALYFVDVIGVGLTEAALAVTVWTVVGLAGDLALIPLLERVNGLRYLRVSAILTGVLFVGFILASSHLGYWPAVVLLGALGFLNAGWYSILQAQVYTAMPGRSGGVMAVSSASAMVGGFAPLGMGALAGFVGLEAALWVLLISPVALVLGIPRSEAPGRSTGGSR